MCTSFVVGDHAAFVCGLHMFLSLLATMVVTISDHSWASYAEISNSSWCCNRASPG